MKNFVLIFVSIFIISLPSFCAEAKQVTLGKIEESLYGFKYDNEQDLSRLDRLEKTVYGKGQKGTEQERLSKLCKDISADSIGQEIPPVEDTFAEYPEYLAEEEPQETSDVSYPMIDEMENRILKQVYKNENIKNRLARLEQKVFSKTYNDDLSTRTERLKAQIRPQSFMDSKVAQSSNYFYDDELVDSSDTVYHLNKFVPQNSFDYEAYNDSQRRAAKFYDDYSSQSRPVSVSAIEKKLYKHSYNNDPTDKRLARIESSMFGTQFSSDDEQTRIDRISSAYKAEKSAGKYDSNKFAQNMATAMQIGTILLMVLACIL